MKTLTPIAFEILLALSADDLHGYAHGIVDHDDDTHPIDARPVAAVSGERGAGVSRAIDLGAGPLARAGGVHEESADHRPSGHAALVLPGLAARGRGGAAGTQ